MTRDALLRDLAARITAIVRSHPTRVAIDGPDTAGKTTLANELAALITARPVFRASIDNFHHPRATRYAPHATPPRATTAPRSTTPRSVATFSVRSAPMATAAIASRSSIASPIHRSIRQ